MVTSDLSPGTGRVPAGGGVRWHNRVPLRDCAQAHGTVPGSHPHTHHVPCVHCMYHALMYVMHVCVLSSALYTTCTVCKTVLRHWDCSR